MHFCIVQTQLSFDIGYNQKVMWKLKDVRAFVCNVQMAWRYLHFSRIDIKMQFSLKSIFVLFHCSRNKKGI